MDISRCSDDTYDINIQSFLVRDLDSGNEDGYVENEILLNTARTTIHKGCKDLMGFERTIPLTTEPDRYRLKTEVTYEHGWLFYPPKKETIVLETEPFYVLEGQINGNGASTTNE